MTVFAARHAIDKSVELVDIPSTMLTLSILD